MNYKIMLIVAEYELQGASYKIHGANLSGKLKF